MCSPVCTYTCPSYRLKLGIGCLHLPIVPRKCMGSCNSAGSMTQMRDLTSAPYSTCCRKLNRRSRANSEHQVSTCIYIPSKTCTYCNEHFLYVIAIYVCSVRIDLCLFKKMSLCLEAEKGKFVYNNLCPHLVQPPNFGNEGVHIEHNF